MGFVWRAAVFVQVIFWGPTHIGCTQVAATKNTTPTTIVPNPRLTSPNPIAIDPQNTRAQHEMHSATAAITAYGLDFQTGKSW